MGDNTGGAVRVLSQLAVQSNACSGEAMLSFSGSVRSKLVFILFARSLEPDQISDGSRVQVKNQLLVDCFKGGSFSRQRRYLVHRVSRKDLSKGMKQRTEMIGLKRLERTQCLYLLTSAGVFDLPALISKDFTIRFQELCL